MAGEKPVPESGKKSSVELKLALEVDRKERATACAEEIQVVLQWGAGDPGSSADTFIT